MRFGSTIALSALLLVPAAARGQEPPAAKYVAQSIREVTIDVEGKRTDRAGARRSGRDSCRQPVGDERRPRDHRPLP